MQKTSKPMRQLQNSTSGTSGVSGVYGSVVDEEGVDSIRFCDVTPNTKYALTHTSTSGTSGAGGVVRAEVVPVLPASLLEDVPLSVLLAESVSIYL